MVKIIATETAPAAIGTYSQGIVHRDTLYISGQIPLDPGTMELVGEDFTAQIQQVFRNLGAIAESAGTSLGASIKLNVYLTNLENFPLVNAVMEELFQEPFPARAAIEVSNLPRGAQVEIDAVVALD